VNSYDNIEVAVERLFAMYKKETWGGMMPILSNALNTLYDRARRMEHPKVDYWVARHAEVSEWVMP